MVAMWKQGYEGGVTFSVVFVAPAVYPAYTRTRHLRNRPMQARQFSWLADCAFTEPLLLGTYIVRDSSIFGGSGTLAASSESPPMLRPT